jgi:hypothetical protein
VDDVIVHPRVMERHPELCELDVLDAWRNCIRAIPRIDKSTNEYIAIGADSNGRLIEMVVVNPYRDCWLIYHAMTPPSKKTLAEIGLLGRNQ